VWLDWNYQPAQILIGNHFTANKRDLTKLDDGITTSSAEMPEQVSAITDQ
jgi:hypothetical protein